MPSARSLLILVLLAVLVACANEPSPQAGPTADQTASTDRIPYFAWVSEDIARGGQPKGEEAYRQLAGVGIVTIISVDGARPDLETAGRFGMRYVHIPFGYDGVPTDKRLQLAKTVRELDGPFFIHCHHGKHRGPAGAVIAQIALGGMTNDQAVAELKRAGTAGKYVGLYAVAEKFVPPTAEQTALFVYDFPNVAPVEELTEAMATVDRRFDGMKAVRSAGWVTPSDHPDISPSHEALQIMEIFVEIGRTDNAKNRPEKYQEYLAQARQASHSLEQVLSGPHPDVTQAEQHFAALKQSCNSCHKEYRN